MERVSRSSWLVLALLLLLLPSSFARGELLITELMADNRSFLRDQDLECTDWIEILNASDEEYDLDGHYLSNDPLKPDKWRFPQLLLRPHQFLLVFCSGKDRRNPASELHANFKLQKEGDKVYLFAPDLSMLTSVTFPEQAPNASYGMPMETSTVTAIASGAAARVFIPTDESLGLSWTLPGFDDLLWREGATAVGFGTRLDMVLTNLEADMKGKFTGVYIRIPFDVPDLSAVDFMTLRMAYDDGFAAFLKDDLVASKNAPATLRWDSKSTGIHPSDKFEEFDISSHLGAVLPGKNILAIQGLNRTLTDPDLFILPELDLISLTKIEKDALQYYSAPTPGKPNGQGFPEMAPRPVFSHESQAFTQNQAIEISTPLADASIRYTLDGTRPTATSTLYTGPITITGTVKVTARVFKDGLLPGIADGKVYTVLAAAIRNFKTNLPLVICSTFGGQQLSSCGEIAYTPGVIMVLVPGPEGTLITDEAIFADHAGFRRRGSSTCYYEKLAFNVEVWDEERLEKRVQILDFPEESDYVMHGSTNYDRSNLHNPLAYWMSRQLGQWAPRTQFVECFFQSQTGALNSANYYGIYAWMEKIKQSPGRVDVEDLTPQDITEPQVKGGYILKRDRASGGEVTVGAGGYSLVMVYPKLPKSQQANYIANFINQATASLTPNIGSQEDSQWIDVRSWIDHHILNWYPKNVDAFRLSGYMFKSRAGLFEMGPVWDYDRSMGGADDDRAITPEGWYNDAVGDGGTNYFLLGGGMGSWYGSLFQSQPPAAENTPWNRAYRARWREVRQGPLSTENINAKIDEWAEELRDAATRNAARWSSQAPRFGSFQGEVNFLKNWLQRRADWIDAQFMEAPRFSHAGGLVPEGLQLEILIGSGSKIYYTLDGTDPKSSTGNLPSASAVLYSGPIAIDRNMRVSARSLEGSLWSNLVRDTYLIEIAPLMITEIMYKPPTPTVAEDPEGRFTAAQMEFIEVKNVGQKPVSLTGIRFTRGVTFNFTTSGIDHLDPGGIAVLVSHLDGFKARYGEGIVPAGKYTGYLSDLGVKVTLQGPLDEIILDFTYRSTWYPETAGLGYSLVNADPPAPADTLNSPSRWKASWRALGTPGADEPASGRQRPGDLTQDGRLTLIDAIALISTIWGGGASMAFPCNGGQPDGSGNIELLDWDKDSAIGLTDTVATLSYLFLAGPPHPLGSVCIRIADCSEACGG